MKYYRLDRKADPKYILDVITSKDTIRTEDGKKVQETLSVKFADGRVFKNVNYDEENIAKIIAQQEKQAKDGISYINDFEKRKTKAGVMTGASIVGGPVIGVAAATMAGSSANPVAFAIGTGIITLAAAIPSLYSLFKNGAKVKELNKIKYRDEHREKLRAYPLYENALVGLSARKRNWFEAMSKEGNDPFCITEIDSYSQNDLELIMENMDTEKQYQFVYAPKRQASAKK